MEAAAGWRPCIAPEERCDRDTPCQAQAPMEHG